MGYSWFRIGIVTRVIILQVLSLTLAFVLIKTSWFFTPVVVGALLLIAIFELIRFLGKYYNNLNQFLLSLKQGGFTTSFPEKDTKSNEIYHTFNEIIAEFQKLAIEKESHYQFLQTLTENIKAGLICFNDSGEILWLNPEAKKFINKPYIKSLEDLRTKQTVLYDAIATLTMGETSVIKIAIGSREIEASIHKKSIIIDKRQIHIILLQNIHQEMEYKEVEAWQKLTQVMRHEIMNSLTPIVGLTEAVNKVISGKKTLSSKEEDYQDILESLDAIENRGKGLLQFVNAYKDFSQNPELKKERFKIVEMLQRVGALFEKQFWSKMVIFNVEVKPKDLEIHADEELLEGVIINIVKNALDVLPDQKGIISILVKQSFGVKCQIIITDNGPGMDSEVINKIFIPFFTTKDDGSGIGLSLSRQIIQLHGGSIVATSKPGQGASFLIDL